MSLEGVLGAILATAPVPGLSTAVEIVKHIISTARKLSEGKKELEGLAKDVVVLLRALDRRLRASSPSYSAWAEAELRDLNSLLNDILQFFVEEQSRSFVHSLLRPEVRSLRVKQFYRRINTTVQAFQISSNTDVHEDLVSLEARLRRVEQFQTQIRGPPNASHPDLQSAADMIRSDAITAQDASGSDPPSPVSDTNNAFEDELADPGSMVLDLASDVTHRIRLVPLEAPSFMQSVVCELNEGLLSPLWVGCPRDEPHPRVAYRERIEHCHAEIYAMPGPHFFLRDPTGRGIRLNGRSLSASNGPSDLYPITDGDIIQLNIRYSDRLGSTHPATRLKIEILPRRHNNSVHSAASGSSPRSVGIPEALDAIKGSTLVQFTDFSDPPSFTAVLCQFIDGARPVPLRRSHAGSTSSVITFDSRTVSRRHAALWSEHGQVFIIDRHSIHGTYLNGDKLVQGRTLANAEVLIDGDILRIGATDERAAIRGITTKLRVLRIAR
ncbi:hypothetical protein FB451DRAFT_1242376 [Mycena latifolia]|nr:hypothetical protein FB451DRAFT_1242376 [Mycena latifolia]